MFISTAIVVGLAAVGLAVPQPEKRARAQVITHCKVPNTAALTFVGYPFYDLSLAQFEKFGRMMVHIFTCQSRPIPSSFKTNQ
jgi:hypothetical protein